MKTCENRFVKRRNQKDLHDLNVKRLFSKKISLPPRRYVAAEGGFMMPCEFSDLFDAERQFFISDAPFLGSGAGFVKKKCLA